MPINYYESMPWLPAHSIAADISSPLKEWLLDEGSLTERLKQAHRDDFAVHVLHQNRGVPTKDERHFLGAVGNDASIREVLLVCEGKPRVFARSILPMTTVENGNQRLLTLGEKPLGAFLFANKELRRGAIELCCMPASQFAEFMAEDNLSGSVWGRRSLFFLNGAPLCVCEVFLTEPVKSFTP